MMLSQGLGIIGFCGLALLPACAVYTPLPLQSRASLAGSLTELKPGSVDVSRPLHIGDVARLAVENSPDLAATRAQSGVAQAQLLQAGVLPNPSVSGSVLPLLAGPASSGPGGSTTIAWTAGISYDIRALITHHARLRGARANLRALSANLLWQEWQTFAQASLLAVDIMQGARQEALLKHQGDLLTARERGSRLALARGDVVLSTAAPDVAAAQQARMTLDTQARLQLSRRHQLNALLGLRPPVVLTLAPAPDLPRIDARVVRAALASLPDRRPDLVALRYGYDAQDAKLRAAILGQFPNLTFGVNAGSDNSNVRNIGPQMTLELPIFDRNQGAIAIERATRQQLRAEYAARLAAATGQVEASLDEIAQAQAQLEALRQSLPPLQAQASAARMAQASGDIDERTALDLITAPLTREQDIVTLQTIIAEQSVAIATLTGAGLPTLQPYAEEER